ncbi:putative uncharacterized domain protein [Xanthomonas citri pv. mangiferaeindicae LMG 941]|nr:putative uncharacterized domain protein [Xanthomonas citri pv. mangiferaeindicae LMG 941]
MAKGGRPGGAVTVVHPCGARRRGWDCGRLRLLGRGKRWTAWRCSNGCSPMRRAAARLALRSPQAAGARQKVDGLEVQQTAIHSSGARRRGWHCGRLRLLRRGKRWTAWRCSNGCSPMRRAAARLALRSPQAAGARQKVDGLEVQ